jgi:hypothetical protein
MASLQSTTVNGVLTVPAGSASAPSITWDDDTDTGIYFPGANEIGFTCNGSLQMRITPEGYVRIPNIPVFSATRLNGSPSLTPGTYPTGIFTASNYWDTISYNNGNNMNTSTGRWTATVQGYYLLSNHTQVSNGDNPTGVNLRIYRNGGAGGWGLEAYNDAGGSPSVKAQVVFYAEVNDYFEFQAGNYTSSVNVGIQHKRFIITYLG